MARRAGGLLLMGEEPDQLGFRALFTIAANCPLLEVGLRRKGGHGGGASVMRCAAASGSRAGPALPASEPCSPSPATARCWRCLGKGEGASSCWVGFSCRPPLCAVPAAPTACRTNSLLSPFGPDSQCLQDLCISEESLDAPVVDNDCLVCVAQVGCTQLPTRFACVSMSPQR